MTAYTALMHMHRAVKMAQFNRSYTTSYQSAFVSVALSGTTFKIIDIEGYRDTEIFVVTAKSCTICLSLNSTYPGYLSPADIQIVHDFAVTTKISVSRYPSMSIIFIHFYTASLGKGYIIRSFKVIEITANRKHTCHFVLIFHCKYVSMFSRFRDIGLTFFRRFYPPQAGLKAPDSPGTFI